MDLTVPAAPVPQSVRRHHVIATTGSSGPADASASLVRALPYAGPSAHVGRPAVVHVVLLGSIAAQCIVLDVAGHGAMAGAALLAVALAGAAMLRYGLAHPLVALRRAVVRTVREPGPHTLPHSYLAELVHVRRAVTAVAGRPGTDGVRWCYWPAAAVVAGAVVPVLVWSAVVATAAAPLQIGDPAVAVATQRGTLVAERVGRVLDSGQRDLLRTAPDRLGTLVDRGGRFAGIRTWTPDGGSGPASGRPVGTGPAGDYGLGLADVDGRPVLTATVTAYDGTPVVGEFDLRDLLTRLHAPELRVTVLDRELRTVLDTGGFVAFAPVAGPAADAVATGRPVLAGATVLTSAPLTSGPAAALGWTVLVAQPAAALLPPGTDTSRPARLVALLAALAALGTGVVHLLWHVLPLRRAARLAAAMVAGDRTTVVVPERHDDVGAVLMCLDMLRRTAGGPSC